ncbi:MAG: hypothetical protein KDD69_10110 [Bdellovibrionales bacterium]|nr:hypothetical protein [Bdellovibrionales bacterium]
MLLTPEPQLEERIVQLFAVHPSMSALQIQQRLQTPGGTRYTIQAVYQELRKLLRAGVVLKTGERYSIRLGWMVELLDLSQRMYANYFSDPAARELLPEQGRKRTFYFYDMQSLVRFTTHLGLLLYRHSVDRVIFEYAPHLWYHLAHGRSEEQFVHAVKFADCRYYAVVRGDTYLDRSYQQVFGDVQGELFFGRAPKGKEFGDDNLYVAGDYVVKVKLPPLIRSAISALFETTRSGTALSIGAASEVFHQRGKISLTISHNAKEAERLRRLLRRFCGV